MAKRKKNKGGLAAALICLFMAAATLLRGGRIDLPAVSDALGEVSDAVSDLSQTPAEPVDGLFEMIALDVGQGDSFLLRTQEQTVLIDTGEAEYADTVVSALKEYGVEQLDLVIATHMHSDHMGGMAEVLEGLQEQNPQEIAEKILSYAICASEGRIRDDMTVFVLCLWENT